MTDTAHIEDLFVHSWDGLRADDAALILWYKIQMDMHAKRGNRMQAGRMRALLAWKLCKDTRYMHYLTPEQINDVVDDLAFLKEPWYTFHVTWIDAGKTRLLPPDEKVCTFTFWQFCKVDAEYSKYMVQTYNSDREAVKTLDRLIAAIYVPHRGVFDEMDIQRHAPQLPKRLTPDIKYLIMHTYGNCRKFITDRCPNLFGQTQTQDKKPVYSGKMWQDLLFSLADLPAFSGLDRAKNANIYTALDYLDKKAEDVSNMKR